MRADPQTPTQVLPPQESDAEARLRLISEAARLGVWEWDMGETVTWSETMEALFGLAPGEFPGTFAAYMERVHPDDREHTLAAINAAVEKGTPLDFEHRVMLPDGRVRWLEGRGNFMRDAAGNVTRMIGVGIDIDERKRTERALLATQERQRALADTIPAIICAGDTDGQITYYNQRWYEYTGNAPGPVNDDQILATFHPDERETISRLWREAVHETHEPYHVEYRLLRHDGEYRWHIGYVSPVRDNAGRIIWWISSSVDIHEARVAANAIAESEARYRSLAELMPAMITVHDPNGGCIYSNQHVLDYTGLKQEDLRDANWLSVFHPDDLDVHLDNWLKDLGEGKQVEGEFRARKHDGTYRWHLGRVCPVKGPDGEVALWIAAHIDIDERRRAEEERARIERRYLTLAERSPLFIFLAAPDGSVTYNSQRFYDYTGTSDTNDGQAWEKVIHPEDLPGTVAQWTACVASGEQYEREARIRRADGEYRWHLNIITPTRDSSGAIVEWVGVATDIDDLRRAEDELRQANAAKDEFLGLVSHELRTPITTILGNAEVLQRRFEHIDAETRTLALGDIRAEAERLHRIIDNLLVLARLERGQQVELEPLLVRRLVHRVVDEQARRFPHRQINVDARVDATPVVASPDYVEQVLRNLLSNAEKYSAKNEPIDIEISHGDDGLCVCVLDRGIGVPADEIEHVFTAFYRSPRTAERAQGVGIGLAVCKRLIEAQGGRVWARARDGGGTEFGFCLPIAPED